MHGESQEKYPEVPDYSRGYVDGYRNAVDDLFHRVRLLAWLMKSFGSVEDEYGHKNPWMAAELESALKLLPVEVLDLDGRIRGAIRRAGINTIADLLSYGTQDLTDLHQIGTATVAALEPKLAKLGLSLQPGRLRH